MRYEVFSPKDGVARYTTSIGWLARLLAWWYGLDYALENEGWLD